MNRELRGVVVGPTFATSVADRRRGQQRLALPARHHIEIGAAMALSPVITAIDDGHIHRHADGKCYKDEKPYPCPDIIAARKMAAALPVRLKAEKKSTETNAFRY